MPDQMGTDLLKPSLGGSIVLKTIRLSINTITNVLLCITVFLCVWFACSFEKITEFHWHVILCVLGYQFFMCQGILVLSTYNSWSMYLSRHTRRYIHIVLQLIGIVVAAVGTYLMMSEKTKLFSTAHGSLGICAIIISAISILNGGLVSYGYKLTKSYSYWLKCFHFITGVFSLVISSAALTTGLQYVIFEFWMKNHTSVEVLIFVTWLFTLFVALDFWIAIGMRLRNGL